MKFLVVSAVTCFFSFAVAGIFFSFSDFDKVKKELMAGKYNYNFSKNIKINMDDDENWEEEIFSFKTAGVKEIELKSMASELHIQTADVEEISLSVKMKEEDLKKTFKAEVKNGKLVIDDSGDDEDKSFSSFFGDNKSGGSKLSITIPKNLKSSYDLEIAFGDIKIEDISGEKFKMEVAAGDIEIKNITFDKFELEAAAGDIELVNLDLGEGSLEAAAGDIDLVKLKSKGKFELEAAAGDIDVEMDQSMPNIKISAAAGDIDFSLTKGLESNFTFENSTTVGSLTLKDGYTTKDGDYIYGKGEGRVEIETTFGDIEIK